MATELKRVVRNEECYQKWYDEAKLLLSQIDSEIERQVEEYRQQVIQEKQKHISQLEKVIFDCTEEVEVEVPDTETETEAETEQQE